MQLVNRKNETTGKPCWLEHDYPAICMSGDSKWFGLNEPVKPFYVDEWKGKEVVLLRSQGGFIKQGENPLGIDIEFFYEERPLAGADQ